MFCREIFAFFQVCLKVVEFNLSFFQELDQFPISFANDGAGWVFVSAGDMPKEGALWGCLTFEQGQKALPIERGWMLCDVSEIEKGGEEVEAVDRKVTVGGLDLAGPVDERRNTNSTFVDVPFSSTEFVILALQLVKAVV